MVSQKSFQYFWQCRQNGNRSIIVEIVLAVIFVYWYQSHYFQYGNSPCPIIECVKHWVIVYLHFWIKFSPNPSYPMASVVSNLSINSTIPFSHMCGIMNWKHCIHMICKKLVILWNKRFSFNMSWYIDKVSNEFIEKKLLICDGNIIHY